MTYLMTDYLPGLNMSRCAKAGLLAESTEFSLFLSIGLTRLLCNFRCDSLQFEFY